MGQRNAEVMIDAIGAERARTQSGVLNRLLAAQGWGLVEAKGGHGEGFTVKVTDCFECSSDSYSRKGCNFMRGYLSGSAKATFGRDFESKETKCVLKGADACEFLLNPA